MEKVSQNKVFIPYARDDGYNPSVKCDNPIQEKWIHKQVVVKTGDGEDDFILDEKPVKVDEVNIQKSIDEEAKTTDLKYLLKQLLMTGDESIIQKRPGFFGDITGIQESMVSRFPILSPEQIKKNLPEDLQALSVEEIAKMSDEDIVAYFNKVRKEHIEKDESAEVEQRAVEKKEGE